MQKTIDDSCEFNCSGLFVSNSPVTCSLNVSSQTGMWSANPQCVSVPSALPDYCAASSPVHGAKTCPVSSFGDVCLYSCQAGFGQPSGFPLSTKCWLGGEASLSGRWAPALSCPIITDYCPRVFGCMHGHLGAQCSIECGQKFSPTAPTATCTVGGAAAGSGVWRPAGNVGNSLCVDFDECQNQICNPGFECVNLIGSFFCAPRISAVTAPEPLASTQGGDTVTIALQFQGYTSQFLLLLDWTSWDAAVESKYYLSLSYGHADGFSWRFDVTDITWIGCNHDTSTCTVSFKTSPGLPTQKTELTQH